jgi:hypothetical protein
MYHLICTALYRPVLQELYIKGNELGDEGVKAVCEALQGHKGGCAPGAAGSAGPAGPAVQPVFCWGRLLRRAAPQDFPGLHPPVPGN